MTTTAKPELNGARRAAILLVLLGEEAASAIYRNLPQEDLERLTQEIAELNYVSPETASQVLQDYYRLTLTQEYLAQGGTDYATQLLVKTFGDDQAKALLDQVLQAQEARAGTFDSVRKADPQQLAKFVEGEHPQTVALVLAHLGVKPSAALLPLLPEKLKAQAVKRLAEMQQFSPDMVQKISSVLHRKLLSVGDQSRRAYGGVKAVADILNRLELTSSKTILETIEQDDPRLTVSIRNLMFTFEDFLGVPENSIREVLAIVDKKSLALALKGASEEVKTHIFRSMSSRAVEMLKEDMEVLGPVPSREVSAAQQEIVAVARKLESEGKLTLKMDHEEAYVV